MASPSRFCRDFRSFKKAAWLAALLTCCALGGTGLQARENYSFEILAEANKDGISRLNGETSINDQGTVAYNTRTEPKGSRIYVVKEGKPDTKKVLVSTSGTYDDLKINNAGAVVFHEAVALSKYVRVYTPTGIVDQARGNTTPGDYYNYINAAVSINDSNTIAFTGQPRRDPFKNKWVLANPGPNGASSPFPFDFAGTGRLYPAIANNGRIVLQFGDQTSSPLALFSLDSNRLLTPEIIAGPDAGGFKLLGNRPAISDDGSVVVFCGDRGNGPGIFAIFNVQTGSRRTVTIAGENEGPRGPRAELGQDAESKPIYFRDLELDYPTGVVHVSGKDTDDQTYDMILVCFRATPSAGNGDGAFYPEKFTGDQGLWCAQYILGNDVNTFRPVVQNGDFIKGKVINAIEIHDPIAQQLAHAKSGDHWVVFQASADGVASVIRARFPAEKECEKCKCKTGDLECDLNSIDAKIGLGRSLTSGETAYLQIAAKQPSGALATPAALSFSGAAGFKTNYSNNVFRQVANAKLLADVQSESNFKYHIRFYTQFEAPNQTPGLYTPIGSPFSTITIENPDGAASTNILQLTRNGSEINKYVYHPDNASWELQSGFANGARKEFREETTNNGLRTVIRTVKDAKDQVLSRSEEIYQTFDWDEELVESREGLSPELRITAYAYYTNAVADGSNYGHLRKVTYPDGRWESYREYHAVYGLLKSVTQFQNNPYTESAGWPDPENRSSESVYANQVVMQAEYLKGHPVSRRWHVQAAPNETWDVVGTNPEISNYSHPSNLITKTYYYLLSNAAGARAGQVYSIIRPDNTTTIYSYRTTKIEDPSYRGPGAVPLLEVDLDYTLTGRPNTDFSEIIDGTTAVEITDRAGNFLERFEYDAATIQLILDEYVTARDAFGRPTRIDYLDGTYVTRTYGCCGLEQETDREGVLTQYNPDKVVALDLDHNGTPEAYYGTTVTRTGISTHTLTDPLGRAFKTILQGTNGALIVQDERHYNTLGDLDWSKDVLGRITTYSQTNQGGFTLRTTTFPDGSQSIESTYQDGSAYETRGSAVQSLRYAYDVRQDNGLWVQTTTQTRLEADGSLSPEYTTTYTDFTGRSYKTEYPWPDGPGPVFATRAYNAQGQLVKSTDPDGLTTLYAYNGRGELETTALDLANPGVIDFAGTDRITRTTNSVENSALRGTVVRKTVTELWETNGVNRSTVLQTSETSAEGTQTWATQYGLTTHTTTAIDRGNQRRTVTTENPDHTSTVTVFEQGRQKSVTRLDKNGARVTQTTFAYDPFGRLQAQADARSGPTTYTYYDDGQLHTVTTPDPDPGASGPGLDPQTTCYTYYRDPANGIKTVTALPDGGVVTQEYFPGGQLKKTWGARTYPAEYTYDRAGRMATLTTWQQFNFGTGTGIAGSATTRWNYNARGLLANKRYADNKGPSYTYTAGSKLKTRLWARGVLTTYGYDAQTGDLLTTTYSDATPAVTNTYSRSGQLQSVLDASGLRTFGYRHGQTATEAYGPGLFAGFTLVRDYDDLDRQAALSVTSPTGAVYHVTYGYDAASRLSAVTSGVDVATYAYHPDSGLVHTLTQAHSNAVRLTTTKLYDKLGRLQSITSVPSADSPISFAYQYNDANQRTRATLANGEYWTYGYDPLGQVTNGVKRFPTGAPIPGYSFGYDFDEIGNRLSASREAKTDVYTNNVLNQIAGINQAPWLHVLGLVSNNASITVNGQMPVRSNGYFYAQLAATSTWNTVSVQARAVDQATNGSDALAEESGHLFQPPTAVSLQYDDDGNLLSDGRWSMTWDAENRVIKKETLPTVPQDAQRKLEYTLDAQGRRGRIKLFASVSHAWSLVSDQRCLASDFQMLAELHSSGNAVTRSFVWGQDLSHTRTGAGGVGGLLSFCQGLAHFAAYDGNGNVSALINAPDGKGSASYEYEAFGSVARMTGPVAMSNPFRFSTKCCEDETGDLHFENRDFHPAYGRWLSRDPLDELADVNLYSYTRNDPVAFYDLLGLKSVAEVLDAFFSTSTQVRHWVMDQDDEYTKRVRNWEAVKAAIQLVKQDLQINCSQWNKKHRSKPSWKPPQDVQPPPNHTRSYDPKSYRHWVDSPTGTDPKTARNAYVVYLLLGYQKDVLWTSAVGSFDLNVTVDCVECDHKRASMRFWMYNAMTETSLGDYAKYFPKPGSPELTQRNNEVLDVARQLLPGYPSLFYHLLLYRFPWSGSEKAVQHMWWNWTEEYQW